MARLVDNYCVGCALECIHCGREKDVIHFECDSCGADNIDGETRIFNDGEYHFCWPCLIRKHLMDFANDMLEEYGEGWVSNNYDEMWIEKG